MAYRTQLEEFGSQLRLLATCQIVEHGFMDGATWHLIPSRIRGIVCITGSQAVPISNLASNALQIIPNPYVTLVRALLVAPLFQGS